jgi:hypothetical protein
MPVTLAGTRNNPLVAEHIERVDDLPEYPVSHEQGYVYAVKAGGRSREELVQMIYKVSRQYHRRALINNRSGSIFMVSARWTEGAGLLALSQLPCQKMDMEMLGDIRL